MGGDSLFYRDFKAKYFPRSDFLQAGLGANPSYAWRSIMAGQNVVKKRMRWQVGNGQSILIWTDKQTLNPSTYKIVSPPVGLPLEARVCELIDPTFGTWKTNLIKSIFLPHEVNDICSIALSLKLPEDRQVWAPTNNGKFSVRSATEWLLSSPLKARLGLLLMIAG